MNITAIKLDEVKLDPYVVMREAQDEYVTIVRKLVRTGAFHADTAAAVEVIPWRAIVFASVLTSQPFDIRDAEFVRRAATASLCLNHFAHAIDDVSDTNQGQLAISTIHMATLMLSEAMKCYMGLCRDSRFWRRWDQYATESSRAERQLLTYSYKDAHEEEAILRLMGTKSAWAQVNAALFAAQSGRWDILPRVERGLSAGIIGVQLIDDLLDWEEDVLNGTHTLPLVRAVTHSGAHDVVSLRDTLYKSDFVADILGLAVSHLDEAGRHLREVDASQMVSLLEQLKKNINEAYEEAYRDPMLDWIKFRKRIDPRLGH
jgi:hypothetical protein